VWAFAPDPAEGPGARDDPDAFRRDRSAPRGGWAEARVGPVWLGRVLGSFVCGGSVFASTRETPRPELDPDRYGSAWGRLRKDLFGGALRLEGEVGWEVLGEMRAIGETLPSQSQLAARLAARIGDAILTYRSENILNQEFLSSAFDDELGYVKITGQNVVVGLSWVLLD
jgi:hypothetical protein